MKIEWETEELEEFTANLAKFATFEAEMERAARELAKILRDAIKRHTPTKTFTLYNGWRGHYTITKKEDGVLVEFTNNVPYAWAVNYGHYAKNQFGGPYQVRHRTVALDGRWGQTESEMRVYGHFFVEKGVLDIEESSEVERIVMNAIHRWWRKCLNGK